MILPQQRVFLWFFFLSFLAAGVERESEEEKSFGDFIIESNDSPYRTLNFTFGPNDFSRLVEVTRYNVLNNKDTLLRTLNLALQRRKLKKVTKKSNTWAVSEAEHAERLQCTKAVRFRIVPVDSWKLSSWEGRSTPDTENSFQVMCSDENSRGVQYNMDVASLCWKEWGITQPSISNHSGCFQMIWEVCTNHLSIWRISFQTILSNAPPFCQRCVGVWGNRFLLYFYLLLMNLPSWTFTTYVIIRRTPQIKMAHWERKWLLLLSPCYWLMPMCFQDWTVITCFPFCHSWFQFPSYPSQGF